MRLPATTAFETSTATPLCMEATDGRHLPPPLNLVGVYEPGNPPPVHPANAVPSAFLVGLAQFRPLMVLI